MVDEFCDELPLDIVKLQCDEVTLKVVILLHCNMCTLGCDIVTLQCDEVALQDVISLLCSVMRLHFLSLIHI